jgi:hypothetical protein
MSQNEYHLIGVANRGMSEIGCNQLLLDAQSLRQILIDAPTTMMSTSIDVQHFGHDDDM